MTEALDCSQICFAGEQVEMATMPYLGLPYVSI